MNPLLLELLPYIRKGYCCSQLLMLLLLQSTGEEAPELVRAMEGLCHGMGNTEGPCGLLTGGACVLGCVAGRGTEAEDPSPMLAPLLGEYQQWFASRTDAFGGSACYQISAGLAGTPQRGTDATAHSGGTAPAKPDATACGALLAESWEKICQLLEEYGIPMEMRKSD